ncbi:alpha/beta hydrolase [Aequorivita capsosiphonis]|uniref:alpha/beta hydrolase n=1 Tax=Aequorivita capsosiphonis TaxID=487317 RepID=UPI0003F75C46|nr:alpha/beta hydrolase [Aequorivita capsosiphonis]
MKKLLIIILLFGIQLSYVSCSKDSDNVSELPLEATSLLDVSYGNNPQQKYDLYLPANRTSTKTKIIALVHGGGWTEGDKNDMAFLIPYIQQKHPNHAIVNINYVLADVNTPAFPNQILNLKSVISKLTNEKNELQIFPEFALIGVSAGAHLSLMYDYVYDTDDQVKMLADVVGPSDFTDPYFSENPGFPVLLSLLVDESAYSPGTDYAEVLSPALQVSTESSPSLLFYGNADPLVPLSNATTLNAALNEAQIDHNFNVYEGGHGNWAQADIEDMLAQISVYVDTYLEVEE